MDILHTIIHNLARFVKFFTQLSKKLWKKRTRGSVERENRNGLGENLRQGVEIFIIVWYNVR